MQAEFLYIFGYETLEDHAANEQGADQESLGFFRLIAGSEEEALRWGQELSRWYTSHLFGNDGEWHWDSAWFASWIEHAPDKRLREAALEVPIIAAGQYPNLNQVKVAFAD